MTRSDSDSLPQRTSEPLPVGVDLPPRVIVCQHGHYWRDYGDALSMPPVSDDNLTCHAVATFALATPPVPTGPCADCGGDHASGHPWHTPPAPAGATLHDMDGHEECASDNCEVTRLCPRTSEPQFASPVPAGDERRDELIRRVTLLLGGDVPAVTIAAIVRYIDAAWPSTGDERLREAADLAADRLTVVSCVWYRIPDTARAQHGRAFRAGTGWLTGGSRG